jgi:hypothetical protein
LGRKSPKVSGLVRGNSRFPETIGGDWFDRDCRGHGAQFRALIIFRAKAELVMVHRLFENWFAQPLYVEQVPVSSMIFLIVWVQPPHFAAQPSDA